MQIFDHDTNPYASDAWIQVFSETADKEERCKYISGMKPTSTFLSKVLLIFLLVSLWEILNLKLFRHILEEKSRNSSLSVLNMLQ